MNNPFRYFKTSAEVIRLAVLMYIHYPLSLRQVEDILFERGIDISHETIRYWWNRFGPMFAGEIRKRRIDHGNWSNWRWHDSGMLRTCRNSPPSMARFTSTSTINATSIIATCSNNAEPPLWPNGVNWQPDSPR